MSKYFIKNCPALQQTYYCNTHHSKCQGCTDCVIKQIVELCREDNTEGENLVSIMHLSDEDKQAFLSRFASNKIINLLDIQECVDE